MLRKFISDVVMSRGNQRFLLTNLLTQIWGVTPKLAQSLLVARDAQR
jgi:hypothetical protein